MTDQQFYQDAPVLDAAGEKIGTLQAYDPQGGYLIVQKGFLFHTDLYIPLSAVQGTDVKGSVLLNVYKDALSDDRYTSPPLSNVMGDATYGQGTTVAGTTSAAAQPTMQTDNTVTVPVREEELVAGTQAQEEGRVRVHKDVIEEQQTVNVPLQKERVTVERVPFSGDASSATDAFTEKDIEVPVMGEEAVVGKQVRGVEEVRVHKDVVTEQQPVSDTVRKEQVVVDDPNNRTTGNR